MPRARNTARLASPAGPAPLFTSIPRAVPDDIHIPLPIRRYRAAAIKPEGAVHEITFGFKGRARIV
jgi:hypothetical protein